MNKKLQPICMTIFCGILVFFTEASRSQTLQQIFEQAKSYSAGMKDKIIAVDEAEEKKSQSYATVLPTISANSDNVWRDRANVGAFGEGYQRTSYLSLSQPLFQGGAEYYAVKIARKLPEIARLDKKQAELQLYHLVAQNFFDLLRLQRQQLTYKEQIGTLEQRVKTLRSRARIGRNKKTDVLAAESQLARVTAEAVQVSSQIVSAQNSLNKITGVENFDLQDTMAIESLSVPAEWERELDETPAIKSAQLVLENSRRQESVARAEFLPSVDLDANYYLERDGILKDSDWDITVSATWNLFSGGEDLSEKRLQALEAQKLEAYLIEQRINVKNDFQSLKKQFLVQRDMLEKLETAVKLAESNYKQHIREANQGLVNQLDVLRVLEEFLQVKRSFDQEIYNVKMSWVKLQVLAGVMP